MLTHKFSFNPVTSFCIYLFIYFNSVQIFFFLFCFKNSKINLVSSVDNIYKSHIYNKMALKNYFELLENQKNYLFRCIIKLILIFRSNLHTYLNFYSSRWISLSFGLFKFLKKKKVSLRGFQNYPDYKSKCNQLDFLFHRFETSEEWELFQNHN